jgi:hypothetical protein
MFGSKLEDILAVCTCWVLVGCLRNEVKRFLAFDEKVDKRGMRDETSWLGHNAYL